MRISAFGRLGARICEQSRQPRGSSRRKREKRDSARSARWCATAPCIFPIRSRNAAENAAEAGATWQSSRYCEVFVRVAESARNRGLGKSVVSAVSVDILAQHRTPVYMAGSDNVPSQRLALRLGYQDTGSWELSGAMSLR